jgi:hypothetical protein
VFDTDLDAGTTWNGLTLASDGQTITGGLSLSNLPRDGSLVLGDGTNGDHDDIYLHVKPPKGTVILIR